jgi:hypothetical protein
MTITPVNIWYNGLVKTAEEIKLRVVADDLESQATFYYELVETDEASPYIVVSGNLHISGSAYTTWKADTNINLYAYTWAAGQLNLTLN